MATVWLAHDLKHDRPVALKVLRPELAASLGPERFLAEIRTTARLQHPHIVPLFDSGEAGGFLYYVMPCIEGESLRARLDREKRLDVEAMLAVVRPVAQALAYAHDRGVVHRDIKPENILLSRGQSFVTDFGIARAVSVAGGSGLTATGVVVGTPAYMSPEVERRSIRNGDLKAVQDFFAKNPSQMEMRDVNRMTPLMFASFFGQTEVAAWLIEKGADVNYRRGEESCLHQAAQMNHARLVALLLDNGADIEASKPRTPLYYALSSGAKEAAELLVERGAVVPVNNYLFHNAVRKGMKTVADRMIAKTASARTSSSGCRRTAATSCSEREMCNGSTRRSSKRSGLRSLTDNEGRSCSCAPQSCCQASLSNNRLRRTALRAAVEPCRSVGGGTMRTLHLTILVSLVFLPTASPAVDERIARVEAGLLPPIIWKGAAPAGMSLSDRLAHYRVPGISLAVIDKGAVAWARGWGVVRVGETGGVTTGTLFQAGSVSKSVAALLTLRLASSGRLALDDSVNARLKSWRLPDSEAGGSQAVTIRHLLAHTAGLVPVTYEARDPGSGLPTALDLLQGRGQPGVPPVTRIEPPGTRFSYSNSGFLVLQQLLVDLSGQPFDELASAELFVPLQMTSTTFAPVPASKLRARMAWGHDEQRIPIPTRGLVVPPAVGGLWATPLDLARLLGVFARSYRGERDGLLTPGLAREAMNVGPGDQGLWGAVEGAGPATRLIQMGSMPGFIAYLVCYPALGRGGVVMINAGGASAPLVQEVMRAVAREYDWPDYVTEYERTELPPGALEAFVGEYEFANPRYPRIRVTSSDGRLHWAGREMVSVVGGTFVVPNASIEVRFIRDAAGTVVAADYGTPGMRKTRVSRKSP